MADLGRDAGMAARQQLMSSGTLGAIVEEIGMRDQAAIAVGSGPALAQLHGLAGKDRVERRNGSAAGDGAHAGVGRPRRGRHFDRRNPHLAAVAQLETAPVEDLGDRSSAD